MKIYIGKSEIHGKGIFASQNIKKGEIVVFIKGKFVNFEVKNKKDAQHGPNWIGVGHNTWVDPASPLDYLNHSCAPNAGIKGKVTMAALKKIKKDEEITIDYSITEETLDWKIKCCCGAKSCRKIIRSIQFLSRKTFHKYSPYIGNYFKNIYLKFNNK